jgi:V/A-type H+-transporting ATPase subunit D
VRELTATRSVLLELKDERRGLTEGYQFLDEKRMVLAGAILDELHRYQPAAERFQATFAAAVTALQAALGRHGLEGLLVYPADSLDAAQVDVDSHTILGVAVQQARLDGEIGEAAPAANPSPEAVACRQRFAEVLNQAVALAAQAGNLERLGREYRRTARRARALEDVLLPEVNEAVADVEGRLEEIDREEAIRVRYAVGAQEELP